MNYKYSYELTPMLHRILDLSSDKLINLQQVPNWNRDSIPKSPIAQKLALMTIPVIYPWWGDRLNIVDEDWGPYSSAISESFQELQDNSLCEVTHDKLIVQPPTLDEQLIFPEITELLISNLIRNSSNPIMDQFENLEIFSIIATQHFRYFIQKEILRPIIFPSKDDRLNIAKMVYKQFKQIRHFKQYLSDNGSKRTTSYIMEMIDTYYEVLQLSYNSRMKDEFPKFN